MASVPVPAHVPRCVRYHRPSGPILTTRTAARDGNSPIYISIQPIAASHVVAESDDYQSRSHHRQPRTSPSHHTQSPFPTGANNRRQTFDEWDDPDNKPYPDDMRYWGMRMFCALFTVFLPALAFRTMTLMNMGFRASALASWMILFGNHHKLMIDNGFLVISRFKGYNVESLNRLLDQMTALIHKSKPNIEEICIGTRLTDHST